jgi:uncharacterized protein (DUF1800 family)
MRILLAAFLFCASFLSLDTRAEAIGYEGARHLLNRTGFGATDAEIRELAPMSRTQAVDRLLAGTRTEAAQMPPAFTAQPFTPYYKFREMSAEQRMAEQRRLVEQGVELRAWWLREMLLTPSPLSERMTLFWHNHFATSQRKVRITQLMYRQNVLLRREALGNFGTLLHAVAKDPAMLVFLDNAGSRRQAPNENFAREVMELFTLGEGHYGERDVKEAARAFTGWSLDRDSGEFTYRRMWHDAGEKSVLGKSGRLDGDGVLDVLLARPETAEFITGKLWVEFVSPRPEPREVKRLAAVLREAGYEMKPLMRAMLTSQAFWAPDNRATLIKSPVELVVGTLRTFSIHPVDLRPAVLATAALGQNLFTPPNVKGWPGGEAWIDSASLLGRKQLLERFFRGADTRSDMAAAEPAMAAATDDMKAEAAKGPETRLRRLLERGAPSYAFDWDRWSRTLGRDASIQTMALATAAVVSPPANTEGADLVRFLVSDPAYQLK